METGAVISYDVMFTNEKYDKAGIEVHATIPGGRTGSQSWWRSLHELSIEETVFNSSSSMA
ncbi:hypothetical protein O9929_06895 [Vibrio lentus]|nr:hypothetical protein [Vibrio lentus]